MLRIEGLHLLLTYECNLQCDHCFVWGSPWQSGTMTLRQVDDILRQGAALGTVEWIYFEGGEPFLHYPVLAHGVSRAAGLGFRVGIVSNGYWATDIEVAVEWLRPFAGLVQDLSISADQYHWDEKLHRHTAHAVAAAERLAIPVDFIRIAPPEASSAGAAVGQLPAGESAVVFRGRAAEKLAPGVAHRPWQRYTECPYEDLREPGRVHVDPLGNVHLCQGISAGNLFEQPLRNIAESYDPDRHPITGPLLEGGPAALVRRYRLACREQYADACHLCCQARRELRPRFPQVLAPDQMYGVPERSEPR